MFIGALYTYGQIQYQYQDVYSAVRQTNANTNVYTAQSNEYQDQNVYSMSETNTN